MSVQKMTFELFRFQCLILALIAGQQLGSVVDVRVAFQIPPLVRGERALLTLVGLVLSDNFKQLLLIYNRNFKL